MALEPVDTKTDNATSYKGNDIDSDGDGSVNQADNAATVGGEPPGNFADSSHSHTGETVDPDAVAVGTRLTVPVYPSKSDVPSQPEGSLVYVSGDGLFVENGQ